MGGATLHSVFLGRVLAARAGFLAVQAPDPTRYGATRPIPVDLVGDTFLARAWKMATAARRIPPTSPEIDCLLLATQTEPASHLDHRPSIGIVHDLIPLHFPKSYPRSAWYYRTVLPRKLEKLDRIVVRTECAAGDLVSLLNVPPQKIAIIAGGFQAHSAAPASATTHSEAGTERHLLYVGNHMPHKNLPRLLQAVARLKKDVRLDLVGPPNPRWTPGLRRMAQQLGVGERVAFRGAVSESQLAQSIRGAHVLVQPSLCEGFGMPMVEAMAAGTPVVCSHASSMPEVCGDAAIYFDPLDVADMAEKIRLVLQDDGEARRLRARGPERASRFDWESAADRYLELAASLR
ncbi:MAG: glycosyltransferase family 4 protein [Planctomycetes bacterium]|nr:glycosyltransferase family 4 protein [Planctomycetota bacterium]